MIFYLKFDYVNFGNNRFLVLLVFCLSSFGELNEPEKLYIREYTSGDLRKNWSQGNTSSAADNSTSTLRLF